jgi:septum formation protein
MNPRILHARPVAGTAVDALPISGLALLSSFPQGCSVTLILASSSPIRRQMLEAAGVAFAVEQSRVDEALVKRTLVDPERIASELSAAKALDVSERRPQDWVIGSDSVVSAAGSRFDKPSSRSDAAPDLRFFSWKQMRLTSGVALALGGTLEWNHVETARLQVRPLSDAFIDSYLDAEWPEVGYCAGAFRLEGRGVQLFDSIDGDYFAILGMPLLPLLNALRERGLMTA